jgi:hypothetical protein
MFYTYASSPYRDFCLFFYLFYLKMTRFQPWKPAPKKIAASLVAIAIPSWIPFRRYTTVFTETATIRIPNEFFTDSIQNQQPKLQKFKTSGFA